MTEEELKKIEKENGTKDDFVFMREEIKARPINRKKLARNGEVLPADKITEKNRKKRLAIPLQNEVVRGYLHRKENLTISSPAVSKAVKKYRKDMYSRLLEKDLSYAGIIEPDSP